jgi:hypothetical protein
MVMAAHRFLKELLARSPPQKRNDFIALGEAQHVPDHSRMWG